jgi:quercetin dioxygenase-like cupin family protein
LKIIKISDVPNIPRLGGIFTGTVNIRSLVSKEVGSKDLTISIVSFPKGIRNTFHTHDHDQVLYVLSGKGIIADEKHETVVTEGMLGFISAGEKHWHGATDDSDFSHISIVGNG